MGEILGYQARKLLRVFTGWIYLFVTIPAVIVVGCSVAWHFIDPITPWVVKKFNVLTGDWFGNIFMKHKEDGFQVPYLIVLGVGIPSLFAWCLHYTIYNGFSIWLALAFHVIRIGPYFMNFGYLYTLCHKEGHAAAGMWKDPYNRYLRNVWNWWVGLFYGVMPASFAYGHVRNHHMTNNDANDIISTGDAPRDSVINFIHYLPRFILYATNVSCIELFANEGQWRLVGKMIFGTVYYWAFFGLIWKLNATFAYIYVLYPLLENILILAVVNWAWHCFSDPDNENNDYVNSVTILDGLINVLEEDYHVVHHEYPGAHWTRNKELYLRHEKEYEENKASLFRHVHPVMIGALAILRKYDEMAEHFVDLSGKMTHDEKKHLLIRRLRHCTWGPLANQKNL